MSTVTVSRADVSRDQIAKVLSDGLGPRYTVLPGEGVSLNPLAGPRPDHPDSIVVGIGSTRFLRAQVTISREGGETTLRVRPGGVTLVPRLTNGLWIERRVLSVLRGAPELR